MKCCSYVFDASIYCVDLPFNFGRSKRKNLHIWNGGKDLVSKNRKAHLFVKHNKRIPLPNYAIKYGKLCSLSMFLSQPAGMESMLNIKELQMFDYLGDNVFRCMLPKLEFLGFEVVPVVDLSVVTSEHECLVEMLSCKFQGSEIVENQNERFSANMKNLLTWDTSMEKSYLQVDVEINVLLEVYTLPFKILPLSAVEAPGNLVLQVLVDKLVPSFLDHLLIDYQRWLQHIGESELDFTISQHQFVTPESRYSTDG